MTNDKTRTISARISLDEFAKALDGLINRGIAPEKLMSNSAILRASILMCCMMNDQPQERASQESIDQIKQLWKIK